MSPRALALGISLGLAQALAPAPQALALEAPPQYVVLAFDNCTENWRWQELRDFSNEMDRSGRRVRFTFFASGINFIARDFKDIYQAPRQPRGKDHINGNFGGTSEEVRNRLIYMRNMYEQGHELASHAVGHFSGAEWTHAEWKAELSDWDRFFVGAFEQLLGSKEKAKQMLKNVIGFRAPYLETSPGLYSALKELDYRYDTSGSSSPNRWPRKNASGLWYFPLADLRIAGSGKATQSMDYTFFAVQSKAEDDVANQELYRRQMLETYKQYFLTNYLGNRAPISIGHHFSPYQHSVYNEALKDFARLVCGLKDVKCVSYRELYDTLEKMDRESPGLRQVYDQGAFDKATRAPF